MGWKSRTSARSLWDPAYQALTLEDIVPVAPVGI
jgi:hypothetical protein